MNRQGRGAVLAFALVASLCAVACSDEGIEERARELQEKVQSSLQNRMAAALAQEATAEDVKMAQQALTAQKEYMGEINGKLDAVTVNAIQAFQRAKGLEDDGILNAETKKLLAEANRG